MSARCEFPERRLAGDGAGREGRFQLAVAVEQEAPKVGRTHRALAGAGAGQGRPLEQLHVGEAAVPRIVEIGHGGVVARAHHPSGRARGRFGRDRSVADDLDSEADAHAGQHIARGGAEVTDHRIAGHFLPADDDRLDRSGSDEALGRFGDRHRTAEVDTGGGQLGRGRRGVDPRQIVARADGQEGSRTGRHDHPLRMGVDHGVIGTHDHEWPGKDPDGLVAVAGIEQHDIVFGCGCGSPRHAPTDHHHVMVHVSHRHRRSRLRGHRERGRAVGRMQRHVDDRVCRNLTCAHIVHAVRPYDTVHAVTGRTQHPTTGRVPTLTKHLHQQRVSHRPRL